jgi:uncharacterized protein YecE (DUF72 family)
MAVAVHVGKSTLEGGIARYARSFDLLEVAGEAGRHPRRPGLLEWRKTVPERFVFSVVVPSSLAAFEQRPDRAELLAHARMVAEALEASWWLVRTSPSVTPSARTAREMEALVAELTAEGRRIAWEPRGVWSDEEAVRAAERFGVHLVRDLAREQRADAVPVVYTRLRALGEGARIGAAAAERVAERLDDASDAFVVVEGAGAGRVRQVLREAMGHASDESEGAGEESLEGEPLDEDEDADWDDEGGESEDLE